MEKLIKHPSRDGRKCSVLPHRLEAAESRPYRKIQVETIHVTSGHMVSDGDARMPDTFTIRVDTGVKKAIEAIAKKFDWSASDVATTLLWMSILRLDQALIPKEARDAMLADMLRILANFAALGILDPTKASDNLLKTALLFSKANK